MVSNGFVNPEPLKRLLTVTDAWNVDLKAWSDDFYRRNCGGNVQPVLETLKTIARSGVHLEVTYLVIPGENDSEWDWDRAALWLAANCGENTPVHVSRYFPGYRQTRPATPVECVFRAARVFNAHMKNVFPGNV
jgi:pyruvate formate lyase activating enzyme